MVQSIHTTDGKVTLLPPQPQIPDVNTSRPHFVSTGDVPQQIRNRSELYSTLLSFTLLDFTLLDFS
jgi:hypothetical protein